MKRQKFKKFIINNWPIWLLIAISAIVYHKWLSFGIFFNGDSSFTFSETLRDYLHYSTWDSHLNLGSPNMIVWMWVWKSLPGFFGLFGFNSNVSDKFFFFWPIIFLSPLFSYLLGWKIIKNKLGAFVFAIIFSFNTYYLAIDTQGHLSLFLAGIFALPVLYFFWEYFEKNKKKSLIIASLLTIFVSGYDFRVMYILFFILLALPFWFLFMEQGIEKKKIFFRKNFWPMFLFFGMLFLLNIFWVWPTVMTGSFLSNEIVSRPLVVNNYYLNLERSLTLFHPFWNGSEPNWFHDKATPFYFWLIPTIVAIATFWARKNRKILFWSLIALVAVFLSKQDARPLLGVYPWLHEHFPGFNAFREASKFYFASLLSCAVLIGYFTVESYEAIKSKAIKYVFVFLIMGMFLWNVKPILTGDMFEIFTPREIPLRDQLIREYVLGQENFSRTLLVSDFSKFMTYSNTHPVVDANSLRKSQWNDIVDFEDIQGDGPGRSEKIKIFLSKKFATNVLSQSGFSSVIVDEKDFSSVEKLVKNSVWEEVKFGSLGTRVFRNKSVKPRIYLSEEKENIHQIQSFQKVKFSSKNPAYWDVVLPELKNETWLNFSENYHPNWRLVCGDFKWYDVIFNKKMFSTDIHFQTDADLNTFKVEKNDWQDICAKENDREVKLGLFYTPQAYLYLGGIVSLTTISISFLTLVFWRKKSHNKKDV